MLNQMYMSPNRLIDVEYQALTCRAFTSFPHSESHFMLSLPLSFISLIMAPARWLRFASPPFTGLSTVSFGSFRRVEACFDPSPFPKRMPLPSLARAGND
jgi:hypothetical protein